MQKEVRKSSEPEMALVIRALEETRKRRDVFVYAEQLVEEYRQAKPEIVKTPKRLEQIETYITTLLK